MEECTSEGLDGAREGSGVRESRVEAEYSDVLLSSTLLRLDETGRAVDADNQASSNFRIERSTVTSLLNPEQTLAIK